MKPFLTILAGLMLVSVATLASQASGVKQVSDVKTGVQTDINNADVKQEAQDTRAAEVFVTSSKNHSGLRLGDHYLKPGAAVVFDHNYDGKTELTESETITLSFTPSYDMDIMSVTVTSTDQDMSMSSSDFSGAVTGNDPVQMDVTVSSTLEGRYYLNVFIETETDGFKQNRTYALPVVVGNPPERQQAKTTVDNNGERVRVLHSSKP
ncbi:hypothetical protein [Sessilibacter sp. MAH2]